MRNLTFKHALRNLLRNSELIDGKNAKDIENALSIHYRLMHECQSCFDIIPPDKVKNLVWNSWKNMNKMIRTDGRSAPVSLMNAVYRECTMYQESVAGYRTVCVADIAGIIQDLESGLFLKALCNADGLEILDPCRNLGVMAENFRGVYDFYVRLRAD